MVKVMNEEFTESEQQWYIANLYVYMNYHLTDDFPINLENVFKMIGFAHKGNAKRTLENNFTKDEDYKSSFIPTDKREIGGSLNEQIMLNVDTFKNLCMIAKTDKGKAIRKYYVKLENIYNKIIKEEIEENKLLLEKEKENTTKLIEEKEKELIQIQLELEQKDTEHNQNLKLNKHHMLLENFSNKTCIYLAEIKENLIKIGSSQNTNTRKHDLKRIFGNCIFLDMFECKFNFREIEQCILLRVKHHLYKKPINGHISKEVVLLNENTFNYNELVRIVIEEIKHFTNKEITLRLIENESKKLDLIKQLLAQKFTYEQIHTLINVTEHEKVVNIIEQPVQIKEINVSNTVIKKGRKIQVINPDNLNVIVKIYDSMVCALRNSEHQYDKHAIQKAVKNNTIYKGFRWMFVNHGDDPNIIKDIKPTYNPIKRNPELSVIVQLNNDKTKIIDTYTGITIVKNKFKVSLLRLKKIIDENLLFNDCYFIKITDCPNDLLEKYKETHSISVRTSTKAIPIKQINTITKEEIFYKSITEASIKFCSSEKSISDSIKNNTFINCYKFEYS
jgi:phage anti-repressor protein